MAKKKVTINNEEFQINDDVKLGEFIPLHVSSVVDRNSGRELSRADAEKLPAANSDIAYSLADIDKGQ